MASTITTSLIAVGGTLVGTLGASVLAVWAERKRVADAERYRNHEQRARLAMDFLVAFDEFRRAIKYDYKGDLDRTARHLADVVHRLDLFFDESVGTLAKEAQAQIDAAKQTSGQDRDSQLKNAEKARDEVSAAMKRQLEPRWISKSSARNEREHA